ncbi:MAG: hypothetical protein ACREC6_00555 [Hyphomicrobiaceae bacterium]
MLPRFARLPIAACAAAVLAGIGSLSALAAPSITRADYEACQAQDERSFKTAIETVTLKALQQGIADFDYQAAVAAEWQRANLNDLIDKRVDEAVAEVRSETGWGTLWGSLTDKEKAEGLAVAVAERVYRSDTLKTALEGIGVGVGKEAAKKIEEAAAAAIDPAVLCLQAFLGTRYGRTVARVVSNNAGKEFVIDPSRAGAHISAAGVLREGSEAIAGAVLLLVRRQLSNMAARIGQRIVGIVLSRVVAIVSGGLGAILIAKDVWEFRHGVLPIVAAEMKSTDTKKQVQAEIVKALSGQIGENLKDIATITADRVVDIWREFRRAHAKVLDLAERHEGFRKFLDALRPEHLARLDEVVALLLAVEGESGVLGRLEDGSLTYAVHRLPAAGMEIARETRSLSDALSWNALTGDALPKVLEYELYRHAKPADLSAAEVSRLLALGDKSVVMRVAGLDRAARTVLFDLDNSQLKSLARSLTESELKTLTHYMTGLERTAGQRVLRSVSQSPAKMQVLAQPRVRDAVLASRDQSAAVAVMLRSDGSFDFGALNEDFDLALDGRISPMLLWYKHPGAVGVLAAGTLFLLLVLRRLLPRPRRRAVRSEP